MRAASIEQLLSAAAAVHVMAAIARHTLPPPVEIASEEIPARELQS
jgi:hypothetical protein